MLRVKRGRPRLKNPSHNYTLKQWEQHQSQPDDLKALEWIKKNGLSPLLIYSFQDLLKSVHGKKPKCFAKGNWNSLQACLACKERNSISKVQGFYDKNGKELGQDCYGIFTSCWIATWIHRLSE